MKSTLSPLTVGQDCVEICNRLLKNELSAVRSYQRAMRRYPADGSILNALLKIQRDHERAACLLRANLLDLGGEPEAEWGGASGVPWNLDPRLFPQEGDEPRSLEGLRELEELRLKQYLEIMRSDDASVISCDLIRVELLPLTRRHIEELDGLIVLG